MSALKFSPLTLGADRIGSVGSRLSKGQLSNLFAIASQLGICMIDTADSYASGESERQLGILHDVMTGHFQVASKVGYRYGTLPGWCYSINQVIKKSLHSVGLRQCFSPSYIRRCAQRSMRRLGFPPALYLLHNPPLEALTKDLRHTLASLVTEGLVRAIGLSSFDVRVLRTGLEWPEIAALQTAVNPNTACELRPMLDEAKRQSIPVMAHSACHSDCLSAKRGISEKARMLGIEPRHLLLQFALQQPSVVTVITSTHSPEHLMTNFKWATTPLAVDWDQFMS